MTPIASILAVGFILLANGGSISCKKLVDHDDVQGYGNLTESLTPIEEDPSPSDINIRSDNTVEDPTCNKILNDGDGDLTGVIIPERLDVLPSFMETWGEGNTVGYVAYGRYVFMSYVWFLMVVHRHPGYVGLIKNFQNFQLRIKADTFVCDELTSGGSSKYKLYGISKFEVIAREIVSKNCEITIVNPGRPPASLGDLQDGDQATQLGQSGKSGVRGIDGEDGRQTEVILSYAKSAGKLKIIAHGGKGGDGTRGTNGGKGLKGKPGRRITDPVRSGPCRKEKVKGTPGGNGGNGGHGGVGGKGGKGGNAPKVQILTPDGKVGKMALQIYGCKGKGGQGGPGGRGGKVTGSNGNDGEEISDPSTNFDKDIYDEGVLQLISGQGDSFYIKEETEKAESVYTFISNTSTDGEIKKYSEIMISKIKSNLNFYGYSYDLVVAEDVEKIKEDLAKSLGLAKTRSTSIDTGFYRNAKLKNDEAYYHGIVLSFKNDNQKLVEETEHHIKQQNVLRAKVLEGISEIEGQLFILYQELDHQLQAATARKVAKMVSNIVRAGIQLYTPKMKDFTKYVQDAIDLSWDVGPCKDVFKDEMVYFLRRNAETFKSFKSEKPDWKEINLSDLEPETAAVLKQATSQEKMNQLKAALFCLIYNNGPPGAKLKAALNTYLSYGLKRFLAIAEIYEIDRMIAKYQIRINYVKKRNTELDKIFLRTAAQTSVGDVEARLRAIYDLLRAYKEAEAQTLERIYVYADSLRFFSLWNFTDCVRLYRPPIITMMQLRQTFDGYSSLESLESKIDSYNRLLKREKTGQGTHQYTTRRWLLDLNKDNSPDLIEILQATRTGIFNFTAEDGCRGECSNARLVEIYAEATFRDSSKHPKSTLILVIEHFGDNYFYIGNRNSKPILLKQNKILHAEISGKVRNQLLKPCDDKAKACIKSDAYPSDRLWKACTPRSKASALEKRTFPTNDICRSPFATYAIKIPTGGDDYNPANTDMTNIVGIKVLFGITYWTNYPKDPGGCQAQPPISKL